MSTYMLRVGRNLQVYVVQCIYIYIYMCYIAFPRRHIHAQHFMEVIYIHMSVILPMMHTLHAQRTFSSPLFDNAESCLHHTNTLRKDIQLEISVLNIRHTRTCSMGTGLHTTRIGGKGTRLRCSGSIIALWNSFRESGDKFIPRGRGKLVDIA